MSHVLAGSVPIFPSITIAIASGEMECQEFEVPVSAVRFNSYKPDAVKKIRDAFRSRRVGSFNRKEFGEWLDAL